MDMTLNRPDIVAEITTLFERYEQALIDRDLETLDNTFWDSPHTIRLAVVDNCWGIEDIRAARLRGKPGGSKETRIRLEILTIGTDLATVNLEYKPYGRPGPGRQSQTWVRFPDAGWRVIAAHVSIMPDPS